MQTDTITITLARDAADEADVAAVEEQLLKKLRGMTSRYAKENVVESPAPYKTGGDGEYRRMRDGEGQPQYTEVRVRAVVRA